MYCSVEDVRAASELLESPEIIQDEKIMPVILKAEGRINSVLKSRYTIPLIVIPDIIRSIAQDMAAGFLIASVFSNQLGQEQINLSNQFLKRADNDLNMVITEQQLDGYPGISLVNRPGANTSPVIGSTSPSKSTLEGILNKW